MNTTRSQHSNTSQEEIQHKTPKSTKHTASTTKAKSDKTETWTFLVLGGTFLLMVIGLMFVWALQNDFTELRADRITSTWGLAFAVFAGVLFFYKAGMFVYTLYLYFRYRSIPSVSDDELPTCTVIVPAYNEGKQVYDTLISLSESSYPEAKLQHL